MRTALLRFVALSLWLFAGSVVSACAPGGDGGGDDIVLDDAGGGPTITSFVATPEVIAPGATATLAWTVDGASTLSLDQGLGAVTGDHVAVTPAVTTQYRLTATNAAGSATADVTVIVDAGYRPLGVNIGEVNDYAPSQIYADLMKHARHWGSAGAPWDEAAPVDRDGWPTGDAGAVFMVGIARTGGETYKLRFRGDATVTVVGNVDGATAVQHKAFDAATGFTTADVVTGPSEENVMLAFRGQPGGVKQVSLMRPGHAAGELFHRAFLARLKYFSALRFMEFTQANNTRQATWSERTLPTAATQATKDGAAWEHVILLANAAGKDVWINVPHLALGSTYALDQADYVTKLAQLFRYGSDGVNPYTSPQANPVYPPLNANLKLYVEWSNELWNGLFAQNAFLDRQAQAAIAAHDPDLCHDGTTDKWTVIPRLMAKGGMRASEAFRAVFGDAAMMSRVRPVMAGQVVNTGTYYGLGWLDDRHGGSARYFYAMAGAPYIDIAHESAALSVDQLFAEMTTYRTQELGRALTSFRDYATAHGLKLLTYEGGQTLYPALGNAANKRAAQTDPRMKAQVVALLEAWRAAGCETFFYYDLAGGWSNAGFWGLAPDIGYDIDADAGYPTSEAYPKWGAVKQFATAR